MLSVKHFLSLKFDTTWDWTLVSRVFGEQPTQLTNAYVLNIYDLGWLGFMA